MISWREQARPIIERVLRETAGKPERAIRAALLAAWPSEWGPRTHHPYKIWLDEIARQRGRGKYRGAPGAFEESERLRARIAEIEAANRAAEESDDDNEG